MKYRIELVLTLNFVASAKLDMIWLCGEENVSVQPDEQTLDGVYTVCGVFVGDAEKFRYLKGNWSQVGNWKDEVLDE